MTKDTDVRVSKYANTKRVRHALGMYKDISGNNNVSKRPYVRVKISSTCLNKSKCGTWHISLDKNKRISYNGVELHCSWELYYAMYLDKNNIRWVRCTDRFLYEYKGVNHYYTPDFYLPQTNEYIEIKGYATGKDYAKWECFPKDKKLVVLRGNDLVELGIDLR